MAVGTGFGQLFRGIGEWKPHVSIIGSIANHGLSGQVGGVAISSAIFQWKLDSALRERIHDPDAEKVIVLPAARFSRYSTTLISLLRSL